MVTGAKHFARLWDMTPLRLHGINLNFEKAFWAPAGIDTLGELLRKYKHRSSRTSTD